MRLSRRSGTMPANAREDPMTTENDGRRIDELLGDDYELVRFRDLPEPHRMAMAWYMGVDGEAWLDVVGIDLDLGRGREGIARQKAMLRRKLPAIDRRYGDVVFGVVDLRMEAMLEAMVDDRWAQEEGLDLEGVRARHASESPQADYPEHGPNDRWPVILSNIDRDTLDDGWNRFAAYVRNGHDDVPALFYPAERHFLAKGMTPPSRSSGPRP